MKKAAIPLLLRALGERVEEKEDTTCFWREEQRSEKAGSNLLRHPGGKRRHKPVCSVDRIDEGVSVSRFVRSDGVGVVVFDTLVHVRLNNDDLRVVSFEVRRLCPPSPSSLNHALLLCRTRVDALLSHLGTRSSGVTSLHVVVSTARLPCMRLFVQQRCNPIGASITERTCSGGLELGRNYKGHLPR